MNQQTKKPVMKGLIGPLHSPLSPSQRAWKQRAEEALARILASGYNQKGKKEVA